MPAIRPAPCLALLVAACFALPATAQRGSGESEGIAPRGERPPAIMLAGTVESVETGPCEMTTGRAAIGVHLQLDTDEHGPVNLHLGPAAALQALLEQVMAGRSVTAAAFRTERLPEGAFIAQSVTVDGDHFMLRDDSLRPRWAIGPSIGLGPGRGEGRGEGPGRALLDESGMATADTAAVGRGLNRTCWWSLDTE